MIQCVNDSFIVDYSGPIECLSDGTWSHDVADCYCKYFFFVFVVFFYFLFAFLNQTFHGLQSTPCRILAYMYTISHSRYTHTHDKSLDSTEHKIGGAVSMQWLEYVYRKDVTLISVFA